MRVARLVECVAVVEEYVKQRFVQMRVQHIGAVVQRFPEPRLRLVERASHARVVRALASEQHGSDGIACAANWRLAQTQRQFVAQRFGIGG